MFTHAQVTLDWCTVGGSAGKRSGEHHKKLQIWTAETQRTVQMQIMGREMKRKRGEPKEVKGSRIDMSKYWAPWGCRFASDGVSIESGSWLIANRVCFEDTGRVHGMAVRGVGHARVNLFHCRCVHACVRACVRVDVSFSVRQFRSPVRLPPPPTSSLHGGAFSRYTALWFQRTIMVGLNAAVVTGLHCECVNRLAFAFSYLI